MRKKVIGVTPIWDDEKQSIWMLPGYMDRVAQAGGIPVILPLKGSEEDILQAFDLCDGLLLTGGHDVSPALYGQKKRLHAVPSVMRAIGWKRSYIIRH